MAKSNGFDIDFETELPAHPMPLPEVLSLPCTVGQAHPGPPPDRVTA